MGIADSLVDWSSELKNNNQKDDDDDNKKLGKSGSNSALLISTTNGDVDFKKNWEWKQKLEDGKKLFNYKPKKGMKFLIDAGHVKNTTKDVARFLLTADGLDKARVGEYIGEREQWYINVLYDYVDHFNFTGLEID